MKRFLLAFGLFFASHASAAEVPSWNVDTTQSSITFTAIQNSAPVEGHFVSFSTDISFDPDKLEQSHIHAEIDIASVTTIYEEVENNLRLEEWFFVEQFPKAEFTSEIITHQETNNYIAEGTLTIRGVSLPFSLPFTLDINEVDGRTTAYVLAETSLMRNAFGVGQGGWKNTTAVADEVKLVITLTAEKE